MWHQEHRRKLCRLFTARLYCASIGVSLTSSCKNAFVEAMSTVAGRDLDNSKGIMLGAVIDSGSARGEVGGDKAIDCEEGLGRILSEEKTFSWGWEAFRVD